MPSPYKDRIDQAIANGLPMIFGVFPSQPDDLPPYGYTVGLTDMGWPELFVIGLQPNDSAALIQGVVTRYRQAEQKPRAGDMVGDLVPNCAFRMEATEHTDVLEELTVQAHVHYDRPVPFLQIVWPDAENRLPSDPGFDPQFADLQHWWRE